MFSFESFLSGWRRARRRIEEIADQPQDVENAKHPQRGHQFIGRRAPGDAPDQAAAIGAFDRPAARAWLVWGEGIRHGLVHGFAVGGAASGHHGGMKPLEGREEGSVRANIEEIRIRILSGSSYFNCCFHVLFDEPAWGATSLLRFARAWGFVCV